VRRRISFRSANLIGSLQDDVNFTRDVEGNVKGDGKSKSEATSIATVKTS
jgi:hypothetical protein